MALQEAEVTVSGRRVHYWEYGAGHGYPVVFLHGGFGNARANWQDAMQTLGLSFHVIAVDLPGFGGSDPLDAVNIGALLRWVDGFLDAKQLEQAALIGHALGALIARLYAAAKPERVPALVLVSGGELPADVPMARLMANVPVIGTWVFARLAASSTSKTALQSCYVDRTQAAEAYVQQVQRDRPALARLMRAVAASRYENVSSKPPVPVLVIWGEEDCINPASSGERMAKGLHADFSPVASCGHLPHLESMDVFAAQVELFLHQFHHQN